MNWHYVSAGQSVGPISDADLDKLAQSGGIQPETLVWNETMTEWQPYSQMRPGSTRASSGLTLAATGPAPSSTLQACSQCGQVLPAENLVSLGGALVCAACKPLYVQKMREGLPASSLDAGNMEYAGIGARLAAKILDGLIFGLGAAVAIGIPAAVLVPLMTKNRNEGVFAIILGLVVVAVLLGIWFYQIWCLPKYGATPGKRIMSIKVVTADGGPISWGRSIGRFFAELLNGFIPLWIGYIIAIFDAQKRTVHDHIAGTRVIKK